MSRFASLMFASTLLACEGAFVGGTTDFAPGGNPRGPTGSSGPAASVDEPEASAPQPSPLRRLSGVEYRRSLSRIFPGVSVPNVTLPADPKPFGFDNDAQANGPSGLLVDAWLASAQSVAQVAANSTTFMTCRSGDLACAEQLIRTVTRRAWRRPATDAQVATLRRFFTEGPARADVKAAAQLMLEVVLLSPDFLYRFESPGAQVAADAKQGPLEAYSLASRLSFLVTAAGPDDALLDAARDGRLDTPEGLKTELDRLLASPESREGVMHFFRQWFETEKLDTVRKLEADGLDAPMRAALLSEFERFIEAQLFEGAGGTLSDLLSQPYTFVNAVNAPLYGVTPPATGWARVQLDPLKRAGVLTQPLFLATHAHPGNASPVLRGVFILEKLMCVRVGSPPAAAQGVTVTAGGSGPTTNRMRYDRTTTAGSCGNCHTTLINPPGYAFENFDTMGRRQETEGTLPIISSGSLFDLTFTDGVDFSKKLAASAQVRRCATERFARYAMGSGAWTDDEALMTSLDEAFVRDGNRFRALLTTIVTHPEFRTIRFASN